MDTHTMFLLIINATTVFFDFDISINMNCHTNNY